MTPEQLELQQLEGLLTIDEVSAARSAVAEQVAGMSDAEKRAFTKGIKACAGLANDSMQARVMGALLVALRESFGDATK